MKNYYRVSRNEYNDGDFIFETEIGVNTLENIKTYTKALSSAITSNFPEDLVLLNTLNLPDSENGAGCTSLKEAIFEEIRIKKFSDKPCRFTDSMMVFNDIQNALKFQKNFRHDGKIYEVTIVNEQDIFTGDMRMLDEKFFSINDLRKNAEKYWNSNITNKPIIEVIITKMNKPKVVSEVVGAKLKNP